MSELRRIVSKRRFYITLLLIFILNGLLFTREQIADDYGLDCNLPIAPISTSLIGGGYEAEEETVDAKAAYARYLDWLQRVRDMPLSDAAAALEREKEVLAEKITTETAVGTDKLDYVAVNNLLTQAQYLTGYADWLKSIQQNKDNMLSFSIFNDPNSFSGRNIIKTAEEFETLQGVDLTLGADGAIDALLSFPLTDYFLLLVLLLFGVSFLEERKKGAWNVVHAAPNGRLRLAVYRIMILFGVSACGVLLLYGTNLVIGLFMYGGIHDFGRALQSVELLGRLPASGTVGGFLGRYILLRAAAAFFVSLLLWLLLTAVNNVKYTIMVSAGVLAAEYSLYTFLPVQSAWNGLKYFNLFTYISLSDLYTNYLNIDLFGYPLGIRSISQLALLPLCLLLAAGCIFVHCRKKPAAGNDPLERIAYAINRVTDRGLCHLRLLGMELYKTLWVQKGVVIMALLVYLAAGLTFAADGPVLTAAESAAQRYTIELAGEITEDTFARMDVIEAELDQTIRDHESAKIAYENGEIAQTQLNVYAYNAATAQSDQEGLIMVRSRAEGLWKYGAPKGFTPWLMDEAPYESIYGTAARSNQHRAAVAAVLALTLLLAGSVAYERQSGMTFLLASTLRGRGILLFLKILMAALAAAAVWAAVYGREFYTFLSACSVRTWDVPVQNLTMLAQFPVRCPIKVFFVLLYGYRLLVLSCGAILVLLISNWVKRLETACIVSCGILLIPSLLYAYFDIEGFRPLAYIIGVEAIPLLTSENGAVTQFLLWGNALMVTAIVAVVWLFRSMAGHKKGGGYNNKLEKGDAL